MKKQAVISILFTFILAFFVAVNVHAGNSRDLSDDIAAGEEKLNEVQSLYDEMQDKIDELEANKENLSNYLASLNQSYDAAQALIDNYDRQIADKQSEIESINGKLSEAESKQAEQYEAMKLRIQYMYESGFNVFNMGYASAIGVVLIIILGILSAVQFVARRKQGEL